MSEFLYAVYFCEIGWMDKGGPDGSRWPEGRYYISSRSEAKLFATRSDAEKYLADSVKKHVEREDRWKLEVKENFNVRWDGVTGTKVEMTFYYIARHTID